MRPWPFLLVIAASACAMQPPREVRTLAGGAGPGFADGPLAAARFQRPEALALSPEGHLFVADSANHRIRKIWPEGAVTTFAGNGEAGSRDPDGPGERVPVAAPRSLAVGPGGVVYVVDGHRHLREIHANGLVLAMRFRFELPPVHVVAVDPAGNLLVAGPGGVQQIARDGSVTLLAALGAPLVPGGLAADARGQVYVSDLSRHQVLKITADRRLMPFAGSGVTGLSDGPGPDAQFNGPSGLAIAPDGSLLVADRYNHRIRQVAPDGRVKTIAGTGGTGLLDGGGFLDGRGGAAAFRVPAGVAVDARGRIYVADRLNHAIRVVE